MDVIQLISQNNQYEVKVPFGIIFSLEKFMGALSIISRHPWMVAKKQIHMQFKAAEDEKFKRHKTKTCISLGKVALNSIVCLTPGGGISICCTIFLIWGSKPMSSIRSASSRAKYLIICNDTLALSSRSTNLPGVATRMSTPLSSSRSCTYKECNQDIEKYNLFAIRMSTPLQSFLKEMTLWIIELQLVTNDDIV